MMTRVARFFVVLHSIFFLVAPVDAAAWDNLDILSRAREHRSKEPQCDSKPPHPLDAARTGAEVPASARDGRERPGLIRSHPGDQRHGIGGDRA